MADPNFFTTPTGIAVIAAGSSFAAGLLGAFISSTTIRATHRQRIEADEKFADRKFDSDRQLASRKFEFDKELAERRAKADLDLAEKKLALDARLSDRKRRQDLAEEVLSSFYQMKDTIRAIRSSFGYAGEGEKREKQPNESPEVARSRDAYYAIVERFEQRRKEMADLFSRRYRMSAWFGKEAEEPFDLVYGALSEIIVAARNLMEWDGAHGMSLPDNRRFLEKLRGDIWEGVVSPDPIAEKVTRAISLMESICRPVLQEQAK
jgi:hypothetical protein